jgi:hypothetical protein
MKNTKLIWRLKESPSSENLRELVKDGILNKEEARQILFSSETEEDRDKESLKSEIKFLRELVEKLSNKGQIIATIKEVEVPVYKQYPWWEPYEIWCKYDVNIGTVTNLNLEETELVKNGNKLYFYCDSQANFSDIQTF